MSSQNTVSVCNLSLLAIGQRTQISSLTESSTAANACNTYFQFLYEMVARSAYWNCLRQQKTLSLLAAAPGTPENPLGTTLPFPPTPWLYAYQLPPDCLDARYIIPSLPSTGSSPISPAYIQAATWIPSQEQIPFHVAYGTDVNNNPIKIILTNQTQAQLVYTVNQPNPQTWDSFFTAAYVATLAAWLVPALALNIQLMNMQAKAAEQMVMAARVRDANEGSTQQDQIPDWIKARNAGGGYYGYNGNGYNYGSLFFPAGV